jgi:ABC-type sugar transport system substrate-binding protein
MTDPSGRWDPAYRWWAIHSEVSTLRVKQTLAIVITDPGHEVTWQITDAANASKVSPIIRAAVTQDPEAEVIQMPYAPGIPYVVAALREMGKSEIEIGAPDLTGEGLKEISEGTVLFNAGQTIEWLGYAAINEIVRGMGGEEALTATSDGLGVSLFEKRKVPAGGEPSEWPGWPDFLGEYRKLWGLG